MYIDGVPTSLGGYSRRISKYRDPALELAKVKVGFDAAIQGLELNIYRDIHTYILSDDENPQGGWDKGGAHVVKYFGTY